MDVALCISLYFELGLSYISYIWILELLHKLPSGMIIVHCFGCLNTNISLPIQGRIKARACQCYGMSHMIKKPINIEMSNISQRKMVAGLV